MGKELEAFEQNYAAFCEVKFCLGVANRLDALRLIFKAYIEIEILVNTEDMLLKKVKFYLLIY